MNLLFAKWIFLASLQLPAGVGLELPRMHLAQPSDGAITELIAIEDVWTPGTICKPTDTACVPTDGGFTGGAVHQSFCVDRGVYVVTMSLGIQPQKLPDGEAAGKLWLAGPGDERILLMQFFAAPALDSFQSGSAVVRAEAFTCFGLRYDLSGPATVNPATTRLTIHRAG